MARIKKIEIKKGICLHIIKTNKFKNNKITINTIIIKQYKKLNYNKKR